LGAACMEQINALTEINYIYVFVSVFAILVGIKFAVTIFEWFIEKLGLETKWMREKREGRDILFQTSKNLAELQKRHAEDVKQSIEHDKRIKDELSNFMKEMKESISTTQSQIKQFAENRVHDREQSFKIQKDLTDAIKSITEGEKNRDIQIEALMCGSKELLGAEIDKRYSEYIALEGIPENELDEFRDIYKAYKGLKGNHRRDAKYEYVIDHLSVIPVETKLIQKDNDND